VALNFKTTFSDVDVFLKFFFFLFFYSEPISVASSPTFLPSSSTAHASGSSAKSPLSSPLDIPLLFTFFRAIFPVIARRFFVKLRFQNYRTP